MIRNGKFISFNEYLTEEKERAKDPMSGYGIYDLINKNDIESVKKYIKKGTISSDDVISYCQSHEKKEFAREIRRFRK